MKQEDSLKILSAEIVNFKTLSKRQVDINGKSIVVVGSNNEGKSSFLQAVFSPFDDNYKPMEVIKDGEESASTSVVIAGDLGGESVQYTVETYYNPDYKKGRLVIFDKQGLKIKASKNVLDLIVGDISFDVDKFLALAKTTTGSHSDAGVKKQVEMLMKFLPEDARKELHQCEVDRKGTYDIRTTLNSEIKILEGKAAHDFSDEDLEKYSEEKSMEPINEKLSDIGGQIENWNKVNSGIRTLNDSIIKATELTGKLDHLEKIEIIVQEFYNKLGSAGDEVFTNILSDPFIDLKKQVGNCKIASEELIKLKESLVKHSTWIAKNPEKPTMDVLLKEQQELQEFNNMCKTIQNVKNSFQEIKIKKQESKELTTEINGYIEKKKQIFSQYPLPVKKLSFDENMVLYDGKPFNEQQHPSSTIIGVGVKIAMAMNPNLKVIIIKDGSLLDKKLYSSILKMIEKNEFQLFIEMVNWEQSELDIKFAESEI